MEETAKIERDSKLETQKNYISYSEWCPTPENSI